MLRVSSVSLPPCGIASRALTARLTMTCSSWPGSAVTCPRVGSSTVASSTSSPFSRQQVLQPKVVDLNALVLDMDKLLRRLIGEDGAPRVVVAEILEQQLGVAGDGRQDVVEVVRDPARQAADRFHLLRLAQLLL